MSTQVEDFVDGTIKAVRFFGGRGQRQRLHIKMTLREFTENCNTTFVSIDDRDDGRPFTLLQAVELLMKDVSQTHMHFDQEFLD